MPLPSLLHLLRNRLAAALEKAGYDQKEARISPATDGRFGDYQANSAMVLSRKVRKNPREVAGSILAQLEVEDLCHPPEIAGAGFINFRIHPSILAERVGKLLQDPRLGVPETEAPRRIVIDFSSPNVAKPMHVGHIRSTILGDCFARTARFLGHEVITDNHLGDWGTQFGKILYGWKHLLDRASLEANPIGELLRLYREVTEKEKTDPELARQVREELVQLQSGDPENRRIWEESVELSWKEFDRMYRLLEVQFDVKLGESFYNDRLAPLVERLLESGLAEVSQGAVCIFFPDVPELADHPCLIQKSDGGFLYATTDLATLEYRREKWNPDAIWYVTGSPQALHFRQVFEAAKRMGLKLETHHIAFGSILGENRKIMKTRSGENVQLGDVLDEAVVRASKIIADKNPDLTGAQAEEIAKRIGIGAVKYAELSQHRMTDYVFSWDKMLSFQGNTAPYLQNAYVRIRSIFRKLDQPWNPGGDIVLSQETERLLALKLVQFGEIVPEILEDFRPNLLANYLYELANVFHSFYEACPVLKSEDTVRTSRLHLCKATSRVIRQGLALLGISCPERM